MIDEAHEEAGNNMQRVFDALVRAGRPLTMDDLAAELPLEVGSIEHALVALIRMRCVFQSGRKVRIYGVVPGAKRPEDGRGKKEGGALPRKPISPERSAWWDIRLDNWGLWKAGGRTGVGSATDGTFGGEVTRPPPPLVGEAIDTDRLVKRLPEKLQHALEAWYSWTGTVEMRAGALHVHRNTLTIWVAEAKGELDAMWWERVNTAVALR